MEDLKGKVAIVTGARRGIGRAIAERLCREGVSCALADINPQIVNTYREIGSTFTEEVGFPFVADVTKAQDVQNLVQETIKRYDRIDILVNNAGVNKPASPLVTTSEKYFDEVMGINFKSLFLCSREVARQMIQQKSGNIINIGSNWGKTGQALFSLYSASKAAGIAFTQAIAMELAPYHIRVNDICPAFIDTEMHDIAVKSEAEKRGISEQEVCEKELKGIVIGRYGTPEEIAAAVVFLVSDEAGYITGQAINISGGIEVH